MVTILSHRIDPVEVLIYFTLTHFAILLDVNFHYNYIIYLKIWF